MKWADLHVHTALCRHARGEMHSFMLAARHAGLDLGFADHAPARRGFDPENRMDRKTFPEYTDTIVRIREAAPDLRIFMGAEADIYSGFEDELGELRSAFEIDYIIGSVHYVDGVFVFSGSPLVLPDSDTRRIIRRYFELLGEGIQSPLVDIAGHLDAVKWIFPHNREDIEAAALDFLDAVSCAGKAVEFNTSGWRRGQGEPFPGIHLIEAAAERGLPICLGSDAHQPDQVGYAFARAAEILMKFGYGPGNHRGLPMWLPIQKADRVR
ncbi:MAG TPA: histidinol-phosphatase HisJ family protein [bacterium]|nr:histidinol-phosphatase HisJ family protein [bacterium]